MLIVYPSGQAIDADDQAIADLVDPVRLIALRPIAIVGPFAMYWSLGKKGDRIRTCGTRIIMTPRVRWVGRATETLIRSIRHQESESRP